MTLATSSGAPDGGYASDRRSKVLVVDDEDVVRDVIVRYLRHDGFATLEASDGSTARSLIEAHAPDLVVLDVMLPETNGLDLCRWIRNQGGMPVILVTARGEESDRITGLELGADDYVVKPFGTRELMARIRAVLRRSSPDARKVVRFSDTEVDFERRVVTRKGEDLKLTPAEYNLLCYFLQNPDRALTRDMILNSVWGYEFFPNTRTVDAHVVKLRQKLEPDANSPRHFLTVHGVGYRFLP